MFRIWIYLRISSFFSGLFLNNQVKKKDKLIKNFISQQSNKKFTALFSQCRVAFYFILKFLKNRSNKSEIIFCAYNLPEMVNVAENLNLKVKFCDLNYQSGFIDIGQLKKTISNKTIAIVLTNMFNSYNDSKEIKRIAKINKITLIEDNAIYFDNYKNERGIRFYSGSLGDYTIYSFNIMKNISSFYGGAASTNNLDFIKYYNKEEIKLNNFFYIPLIKQVIIYFILKLMSFNFLYKYLFIYIIKFSHKYNIKFILYLFYPSLRSIKIKFPKYYFTKISNLSIGMTYYQLKDKNRRKKFFNLRKIKHKYYLNKLSKIKDRKFNLIKIVDKNYQNFLDFPILVQDKKNLNKYLLDKGIEIRFKHYYNCEKMFKIKQKCVNAERYEKELICLPAHPKISFQYIDFIVKNIEIYYSKL